MKRIILLSLALLTFSIANAQILLIGQVEIRLAVENMAVAVSEPLAQLLIEAAGDDDKRHAIVVARIIGQYRVAGIDDREIVTAKLQGVHVVFAARDPRVADRNDEMWRDVRCAIAGQSVHPFHDHQAALFYLSVQGLHGVRGISLIFTLCHRSFFFLTKIVLF